MKHTTSNRIIGADAIRALACLWVFACHLSLVEPTLQSTQNPILRLLFAGSMGVAVFFVLSGFLLSLPFWHGFAAKTGIPNLGVYAQRRLARIVPEYFACILIMGAVAGAFDTKWGLIQVLSCLTFTNWLLPPTYTPALNAPLWSIGIEMAFYVLFPLVVVGMCRFHSRLAARTYLVALMALIVVGQYLLIWLAPMIESAVGNESLFSAHSSSTTKNAVVLFAHFLVGVLAADVYLGRPLTAPVKRLNRYDIIAAVAVLAIVIPLMFDWKLPSLDHMQYQWPTFAGLIAVLLVCVPRSGVVGRMLTGRFFSTTATLSFGIYMWHLPILYGLQNIWPKDPQGQIEWLPVYVISALACAYLAAEISYRVIGKPTIDWVRARSLRRTPGYRRLVPTVT